MRNRAFGYAKDLFFLPSYRCKIKNEGQDLD